MRVIVALVALLSSSVADAQGRPRVNINYPPRYSASGPTTAVSGSSIYATWSEQSWSTRPYGTAPRQIYFNRSLDGGATWLSSSQIVNTNSPVSEKSTSPSIAASGSSVHVAWRDDRNGRFDVYFNRSLDGGTTWLSSDVQLNTNPFTILPAEAPRIAASGSSVYATWAERRITNTSSDIYFNRSTDGGGTWMSSDVQVNTIAAGSTWCLGPQVAESGTAVYVTWHDQRNGKADIYFNRSLDGGATWMSSDLRLDTDPPGTGWSADPQMAASGSNVYVTWFDNRNGQRDIYFNRSLDGGATWLAADVRLDTDPPGSGRSSSPQIASGGSAVYVAWEDSRSGAVGIYFNRSLDGGTTWLGSDIQLNTGPIALVPDVRMAASGAKVGVVWTEGGAGGTATYLNRSMDSGTTWLRSATNVSGSGGFCDRPEIAWVDSSVHGFWREYAGSTQWGVTNRIVCTVSWGFQRYGAPKRGTGGLRPQLEASGVPVIGNPISMDVWNGLGGASGALFLGLDNTPQRLFGGLLLVVPVLSVPVTLGGSAGVPGAGTGTVPLTLPNNEAIIGVNVYMQGLFLDPGASHGVSMTNGMEMWIG